MGRKGGREEGREGGKEGGREKVAVGHGRYIYTVEFTFYTYLLPSLLPSLPTKHNDYTVCVHV